MKIKNIIFDTTIKNAAVEYYSDNKSVEDKTGLLRYRLGVSDDYELVEIIDFTDVDGAMLITADANNTKTFTNLPEAIASFNELKEEVKGN